jgi:phosphoadenosine phosphosulfate reductase
MASQSLSTSEEASFNHETESGYASASSSEESLAEVVFTKPHLKYLNKQLQHLEPEGWFPTVRSLYEFANMLAEILQWAILSLPNLYQTTAFGLTGLVTIDILSKISGKSKSQVDLIFLDTLHNFPETLDLVRRVQERYPQVKLHSYKPEGVDTVEEFNSTYGEQLWENDEERYDFVAKVEPAERAYAELNVKAVLTGRRRSQGGKRGDLDVIEVEDSGLIKINPLANWSFQQVQSYIRTNDVPYNALLDRGYKSVGDWHSTQPVQEGQDERAGRWAGREKTECGLHNKKSRYAQYLMELEQKKQQEDLTKALESVQLAS